MKMLILLFLFMIFFIQQASATNSNYDITPVEIKGDIPDAMVIDNEFNVEWYLIRDDIVDKEYIVAVQNSGSINIDFNLSLLMRDTNFDLVNYKENYMELYEFKNISHSARAIETKNETIIVISKVENGNYINGSIKYDYITSSTTDITSKIVFIERFFNDWKSTQNPKKTSESNKARLKYGNILIPKLNSKLKDDTENGTKYFKVKIKTPLFQSNGRWESKGVVGFINEISAKEYHPDFYSGWNRRRNLSIGANMSSVIPVGWTFNLTFDTATEISQGQIQSDCGDLRIVVNVTENIPIRVVNCNSAASNIMFNFSHGMRAGEVYNDSALYYGNASAANFAVANNTRTLDWLFDDDGSMLINYPFDNVTSASSITNDTANTFNPGVKHDLIGSADLPSPLLNGTSCRFGNCFNKTAESGNMNFLNDTDIIEIENTPLTIDLWTGADFSTNTAWLFEFADSVSGVDRDRLAFLRAISGGSFEALVSLDGQEPIRISTPISNLNSSINGLQHIRFILYNDTRGAELYINQSSMNSSNSNVGLSDEHTITRVLANRLGTEAWSSVIDDMYIWTSARGAPLYLAGRFPNYTIGLEQSSNNAPVIQKNFTIPRVPALNSIVNVTAEITDADLDDIFYANFSIKAPNGSIIFNNLNGTFAKNVNTFNYSSRNFFIDDSGNWSWNITARDFNNADGFAWGSFNVADATSPVISIINPSNNSVIAATNISLNISVSDNIRVSYCWFSIDHGANTTLGSLSSCKNTTFVVSIGLHNVSVHANDSNGNMASSGLINFSATADNSPPTIIIHSPITDLTQNTPVNITVNATVTDNVLVDECWFNVSGAQAQNNVYFTCNTLTSFSASAFGTFTVRVSSNDSANNFNANFTSFNINQPAGVNPGGGGGSTTTELISIVGANICGNGICDELEGNPLSKNYCSEDCNFFKALKEGDLAQAGFLRLGVPILAGAALLIIFIASKPKIGKRIKKGLNNVNIHVGGKR